jgi:hypothetical protein
MENGEFGENIADLKGSGNAHSGYLMRRSIRDIFAIKDDFT